MMKELLQIANYINELEEKNKELWEEVRNLQQDCEDWKNMYEELKEKLRNKE